MDHLPQLQNRSGFRIEVPFLEDARFSYDGHGLEGFPIRCNFTFPQSQDLNTDWESSRFFQSWLFFGTLTEIFKVYQIDVLRDDFVSRVGNSKTTITTRCLPDYIAAWIISASHEYPGCLDRDKHYSAAREVADKTGPFLGQAAARLIRAARRDPTPMPSAMEVLRNKRQSWTEGKQRAKARAAGIWRVLDAAATILRGFGPLARQIDAAVWDSVLVLCTTLQTAAFFIYRAIALDAPFTFTVPFNTLPARLAAQFSLENGWCPREVKIVSDLVEGDHCTLLLCAQLDRRHNLDHSECNAGRCGAYQVDLDTYRTQHDLDCQGCEFLGFEGFDSEDLEKDKLLETIMCNQSRQSPYHEIPMAAYREGQLQLVRISIRQLLRHPFVAISHVWADGLGNSKKNALPRCQLQRIQKLVDKKFPNKGPIPFWMDTLCVPVTADKPSVYKKAKECAIKSMESVYKSAPKVLVLDRTLTAASYNNVSTEEIGLRIMCSGWARRLWTLQEGLYQAKVHYQFADTTCTFGDLNEVIRKKHAFPGRSVTVSKTHPLYNYLANPPNCATKYDPLACFAYKALSCSWPRISSFFKELDIKYSQPDPDWFPGMQLLPGMSILVPRAMRTIAYRTTSRIEDEGVILASLTSWRVSSTGSLLEVSTNERMRTCFKRFAIVPSQLIFLDQKRYEETGDRWIPTSLLAQSTEGTNPLPYEHAIISNEFSWPSPRGITVEYPSFRLTLPLGWSPSNGKQTVWLHLAGNLYTGFIHEAGLQNAPMSLPSNLAIIVPRSINSSPWKFVAVVVSILNANAPSPYENSGSMTGLLSRGRNALANYKDKRRMIGRHEALLDLERVSEGRDVDEMLNRVDVIPMTEFLTPEGFVPWRIG